ncbi:MAG TPA: tyrosine-type recombinase/integrase, partial [Streptosporangiaceae bacterium]|nr:tyrosine-type recombinase/integrase [Streptosporangiaceae bacterium]
MSSFHVRVFAIRRRPGRTAFEVRWRVAGRDKSRSFTTRALADSYRAELVRAARQGAGFDPGTGEPESWAAPEAVTVTWYRHAIAYAESKWSRLAPHSRASLADALATVTPLLTRETGRRPPEGTVRAALYGHAFNPQQRRSRAPDPGTVGTLAWLERVSLPVSQLSDPHVIRTALDGLCTRLDGSPAAANTISRKRAVFHGALGYAVELGLLPANPVEKVRWHSPRAAVAVSPAAVASPAQVRAILAQVSRARPELAAFFGCLYYAALRPEEAVALRRGDLILPAHGRGTIILTAACPRTGTAWTSTGGPHETRGLKHRPDGTIRVVPIPSVLVQALRRHLRAHGTAPDGRLFCGTRGGMLSESVYGRAWHAARQAALGPDLAATALARRPYDLRHAALSLWLNASGEPAEVAARAGNSTR